MASFQGFFKYWQFVRLAEKIAIPSALYIVCFLIITMLNILKHIMLYMFTLFIEMIGDEANGWGTSHLEPLTIMSIFNDMS